MSVILGSRSRRRQDMGRGHEGRVPRIFLSTEVVPRRTTCVLAGGGAGGAAHFGDTALKDVIGYKEGRF